MRFLSKGVEREIFAAPKNLQSSANFEAIKNAVLTDCFLSYPRTYPQNRPKMWITLWKTVNFYTFLHKL